MATSTLRMSLEKVRLTLPTQVTDDTSVLTLKNLIFEPLLKWQTGGLVHAGLFDRWEHSPDGRQWSFHIRENAKFHDGEACTAGHVIDFIAAILDSRDTFGMRWSYYRYLAHAKFTAQGEHTVYVENPEPMAYILDILTEFYICRVAADVRPILGTGRYRVLEYEEGRRAVLEKVTTSEYDSTSPPRIIVTAEPSAEERVRQLRQGEIDAALNLERVEDPLEFDSNIQWGKSTNTLSIIYYLNCREGIFKSPEARLAVNHAIDKELLAKEVFHGLAEPASTIVSPFHLGAQVAALNPIPFDVDQARYLLKDIDTTIPIILRTPT